MWAHKPFFLILLLSLVACKKEQPNELVLQYQLGEIGIETKLTKRNYRLPDLIEAQMNIECPETASIALSPDKSYKEYFQLEHFSKKKRVGDLPHLVLYQYKYVFSAKKPGSYFIPGFLISAPLEGQKYRLKTDSIAIEIKGLLDFQAATDSIAIYPIFNKK